MARLLPIIGASLFPCVMALVFGASAISYPQASGLIPAGVALIAVGMLGSVITITVGHYERRLRDLEERLRRAESGLENIDIAKRNDGGQPT